MRGNEKQQKTQSELMASYVIMFLELASTICMELQHAIQQAKVGFA